MPCRKIPSAKYCEMDDFGRCDWIFQQLSKIKLELMREKWKNMNKKFQLNICFCGDEFV